MKQYSKKAIGLILLIVITSLVLAFLVAGQFYISAFIAGMILPFFGHNTPGTVGCPPARTDRSGGRGFAIL